MKKIEVKPSSGKSVRLYDAQWDMIAAESSRLSTSRDELLRAIVDAYFEDDGPHDIRSEFSDHANSRLNTLYLHICNWVSRNVPHLVQHSDTIEVYGAVDFCGGNYCAYIKRDVFKEVVREAGFGLKEAVKLLRDSNLIETRAKNNTRAKRINGILTECFCVKLPDSELEDDE